MSEMIILLPAKNEEEGIGEVIDRIPDEEIRKRGFEPRVVVVDGSSTDSTREIAREKGAELIEDGTIDRDPGLFVEDYRIYVTDERATSAAHIFYDLGYLDEDQGFTVRC